MSTLEELRRTLEGLEPDAQRALLTFLAPTGIVRDPDVCGGLPRIVRTRIPVWLLEHMRREGFTEATILQSFPTLQAEDLVHAWRYVEFHRDEIDQQIRDNEEQFDDPLRVGLNGCR